MRTERIRDTSFVWRLVLGLKSQSRATLSHSVPGVSSLHSFTKASSDALYTHTHNKIIRMDIKAAFLSATRNTCHAINIVITKISIDIYTHDKQWIFNLLTLTNQPCRFIHTCTLTTEIITTTLFRTISKKTSHSWQDVINVRRMTKLQKRLELSPKSLARSFLLGNSKSRTRKCFSVW